MSNNATSADNPQETLNSCQYYYAGFLAAEMTCSVIRARNHNPPGYYFTPDLTVSNSDRHLLDQVNTVVMGDQGFISPIKGGFNLKLRGKRRTEVALRFLEQYPMIAGDLAQSRIVLLRQALDYLKSHRAHKEREQKHRAMTAIKRKLRDVKERGYVEREFPQHRATNDEIGYFLAGILDGEGSFGLKDGRQLFIMVAMKDRKIIELFPAFLGCGKVRYRKDGVYHFEVNRPQYIDWISEMFLSRYPLQSTYQIQRLKKVQWILNDHTPRLSARERDMV